MARASTKPPVSIDVVFEGSSFCTKYVRVTASCVMAAEPGGIMSVLCEPWGARHFKSIGKYDSHQVHADGKIDFSFRTRAFGKKMRMCMRATRHATMLHFKSTQGSSLDVSGFWNLTPVAGGTQVKLRQAVWGLPSMLPRCLVRALLTRQGASTMQDLQRAAESGACE